MKPTPHCSNRLFEWATTLIMAEIGLGVIIAVEWFGVSTVGALNALTVGLGLSTMAAASLLLGLALVRVGALYLNGRWRYGCYVRAFGCAFGLLIWMQFEVGVFNLIAAEHQLYVAVFVWNPLALFEFFSLCRSILDLQSYAAGVSGNAARNP